MKKLLITCFMMLFLISQVVLADMGAPELKPYSAYISNTGGAQYFDYQTQEYQTLAYGTKVYVVFEDYYSEDNIVNVTAQINKDKEDENDTYVQIKLSDISISDPAEVLPDDITSLKPLKAVFKTEGNGAEMKKGPAEAYDSSGTMIPSGAEVMVYGYSEYAAWNFVDYNGTKGWVKLFDGSFYFYPEYQELIVLDTVRMRSKEDGAETVIIPAGTKITDYLRRNQLYEFTYNGEEGYLYSENVAVEEKGTVVVGEDNFTIYKNFELYQDPNNEDWYDYPILVKDVPKGTELTYEYRNPDQPIYFVEYNGERGWARVFQSTIKVEKKASLANSEDKSTTPSSQIPSGEKVKPAEPEKIGSMFGIGFFIAGVIIVILVVVVISKLISKNDD